MPREDAFHVSTVRALTMGPHTIVSPVLAFTSQRTGHRPVLTLTGVVLLTTVTAVASNPVSIHILRTTPEIAASASVATIFVLIQSVVLTPVGTTAFLVAMAMTVWAIALVFGANLTFRQCAFVVFAAGAVGVLKRLFVAAVLYARWWLQPSNLGSEITTGLDTFIEPDSAGSLPTSILGQSGLFEIWFLILVAVGLEYGAQIRRPTALAIAGCAGIAFIGARVLIAAMTTT